MPEFWRTFRIFATNSFASLILRPPDGLQGMPEKFGLSCSRIESKHPVNIPLVTGCFFRIGSLIIWWSMIILCRELDTWALMCIHIQIPEKKTQRTHVIFFFIADFWALLCKVADVSPIHFRKLSATTDGTYTSGYKYWRISMVLRLWFRAKCTTQPWHQAYLQSGQAFRGIGFAEICDPARLIPRAVEVGLQRRHQHRKTHILNPSSHGGLGVWDDVPFFIYIGVIFRVQKRFVFTGVKMA